MNVSGSVKLLSITFLKKVVLIAAGILIGYLITGGLAKVYVYLIKQ